MDPVTLSEIDTKYQQPGTLTLIMLHNKIKQLEKENNELKLKVQILKNND